MQKFYNCNLPVLPQDEELLQEQNIEAEEEEEAEELQSDNAGETGAERGTNNSGEIGT